MGEARRKRQADAVKIKPRKVYLERVQGWQGKVIKYRFTHLDDWWDIRCAETGALIDSKKHRETCEDYCRRKGWTIIEKPEGEE